MSDPVSIVKRLPVRAPATASLATPRWRLAGLDPWVIRDAVRVVLIAAKELSLAKTRLAPALPAMERHALAGAMFRDVLGAAMSSNAADHVAVVTSDRTLLDMARRAGAIAIDEEFPRGLNAAVRLATAALVPEG